MESMFILQQKLPFVQAMKMGFELTSYQHFWVTNFTDKLLESMQQFMVKIRENEKERTYRFNVV